ncbi:hypothetical protein O181_043521 [Austropuccinia psidii MF-1]|uniref:Uncharacterized protein n=1 Tax=Austropuccinia psidii MF-1 TaxID=1389203 RepID=A0A9Q3DGS4_9BASI|nr:hypothetical protein [Austropuccinia psidii MF-1]
MENTGNEDQYARDARAQSNKGLRKKISASAKRKSQKEHLKEMKGVIPDGSKSMRTIVQIHCHEILNMVAWEITTLPDPPTDAERQLALICGKSISLNSD